MQHFAKLRILKHSRCSIPTKKTIYKQKQIVKVSNKLLKMKPGPDRTGREKTKPGPVVKTRPLFVSNPDQNWPERLKPEPEGTTRTGKNETRTGTRPEHPLNKHLVANLSAWRRRLCQLDEDITESETYLASNWRGPSDFFEAPWWLPINHDNIKYSPKQ